jgi:methylenetetrahydrofolate dehydrogenase (NADP+)/methenyltetrahydrofolate cyclohydrolase
MVKDGVVVIDVGITRVPDETKEKGYVITGDVDFENVSKKQVLLPCSWWSGPHDDSDVIKKYAVGKRNENVEIRKVNKHKAYSFE